jgi:ribosome-associated translation inhibitor RaiA
MNNSISDGCLDPSEEKTVDESEINQTEAKDADAVFNNWKNTIDYTSELEIDSEEEADEEYSGIDSANNLSFKLKKTRNKRKSDPEIRKKKDILPPEGSILATEKIMPETVPPSHNDTSTIINISLTASGNDFSVEEFSNQSEFLDSSSKRAKFTKNVFIDKSNSTNLDIKTAPNWFSLDSVHYTEQQYFPDFFDNSSDIKTPSRYASIRNFIYDLYIQNPLNYLTATDCRKRIAGDACSTLRIYDFLDNFRIINFSVSLKTIPVIPQQAINILPIKACLDSFSLSTPTSSSSKIVWTVSDDSYLLNCIHDLEGNAKLF